MLLQRHLHERPPTVELQCLASLSGASRNQPDPHSTNAAKPGTFEATEKAYPYNDTSELRLGEGNNTYLVVIDWMKGSLMLYLWVPQRNGATFLRQAIDAFPYRILRELGGLKEQVQHLM